MGKFSTAIIGGGAAGIVAAISLSRRGLPAVICDKMPQLGKKILASGNGRCNLLNENLSETSYNPASRALVRSVFDRFGKKEILDFFNSLGLQVYASEGRIFPVTNQASSVLQVLELELRRRSIPMEYNFQCDGITTSRNGFIISSGSGKTLECQKIILCGGGKTYPAYGSDGSLYPVVEKLGHSIITPVPAAVPLVTKDNLCQILQGQKISARVSSLIQGQRGEAVGGELLFTKYGLSGTCILDVSEEISVAMNRQHQSDVSLAVDLAPFMSESQLGAEIEKRKKEHWPESDLLAGILPKKFSAALLEIITASQSSAIVKSLKDHRFKISGTRGWNEAEFTAGGIKADEVQPGTLESKLVKDLYFAGEILDVNGRRGGYNLGWAWASGWIAGQST